MNDLSYYDYELPSELIAQRPVSQRADSRLMVVDRSRQSIEHFHVRDLPDLLEPGSSDGGLRENFGLVWNNSQVIPARLVGYRESTGGRWSGLFLEKDADENWRLICKTRGRLLPDEGIVLLDRHGEPFTRLRLITKLEGGMWVGRTDATLPTLDLLQQIGRIPLPHYIRDGECVEADYETYQTVFGQHPGSIAAPTAGLHFSEPLIARLKSKSIPIAQVTLHVGIGTFRPIQAERLTDHQMHAEWCEVPESTATELRQWKQTGRKRLAIGTTTVRTLESAARSGEIQPWRGETDLFIRPPFEFHAIDALMTNFHLPKSTLLVLVCTFGGDTLIMRAYQEAVRERYRFFSYGDAMLIL